MGRKIMLAFSLLVSAFVLAPFLTLVFSAIGNGDGGVTAVNLHLLKLTSRQWVLLGRSVFIGMGASVGCIILGVPMAFLLNRTNVWGRSFFRTAYLVSLILPPYIQAIVWSKYIKGSGDHSWTGMSGLSGALFVFVLSYYPIVTLLVSSGLQALDRSLEETGLLQRGSWTTMRKITLPLVFPHIACSAILVFVFTVVNFEVADILRLKVYPLEIFIYFSAYYDVKSATVLSLPLIIITMFFVWTQMHYMGEKSYVNLGREDKAEMAYELGRGKYLFTIFPAFMVFLALIAPLLALFRGAGGWSNYVTAWNGGAQAIWYSLWTCAISAGAMVFFSVPIAYCLVRVRGRVTRLLDFFNSSAFCRAFYSIGHRICIFVEPPIVRCHIRNLFAAHIGHDNSIQSFCY